MNASDPTNRSDARSPAFSDRCTSTTRSRAVTDATAYACICMISVGARANNSRTRQVAVVVRGQPGTKKQAAQQQLALIAIGQSIPPRVQCAGPAGRETRRAEHGFYLTNSDAAAPAVRRSIRSASQRKGPSIAHAAASSLPPSFRPCCRQPAAQIELSFILVAERHACVMFMRLTLAGRARMLAAMSMAYLARCVTDRSLSRRHI